MLPEVERIFPAGVDALNRFARIAADESDLLDVIAGSALVAATDPARRLSRSALAAQPLAIARRVIRGWLAALLPGVELTMERVEALRELAAAGTDDWTIEVGGGHGVVGHGDLLTVRPLATGNSALTR